MARHEKDYTVKRNDSKDFQRDKGLKDLFIRTKNEKQPKSDLGLEAEIELATFIFVF